MAKLLIAVKSESLGTDLAKTLTQHEVYSCRTGTDALPLLETLQPDVFVVELSLPVISGLTVLQEAHYKPPMMLALTNLISESVLQAAAEAGVQDILLLPCAIQSVIAHLEFLIQKVPAPDA